MISEEIAGYGAMVHTQENRMLTDYAIVGEATENDIAIGSRGRCCGVITITGKSCHASIPHVGHNPFDFLAQLLPELQKVPMGSDGLFGSSTMSCTRITSSEEGTNIIPKDVYKRQVDVLPPRGKRQRRVRPVLYRPDHRLTARRVAPVSYTHLDVYKRQVPFL